MTAYQRYRNHPYISQSDLKSKGNSDTQFTQRGNRVDCLITTPEEYSTTYYISKANPSDAIRNLLEDIYKHWDQKEEDILLYKDLVMDRVEVNKYGNGKYSWETIQKRLDTEYWQDLIKAKDRIVITEQEHEEAVKMANIVKNHPFTKDFFSRNIKYQHEIYNDDFNGIGVKGLVDIKIEEDSRTYIDIKTIYNHDQWYDQFRKYRYDIQLPFYADIDIDERPLDKLIYIFVDPIHDYPIVYEMEDQIIEQGRYGKTKYVIGYVNDDFSQPVYKRLRTPIKGYYELIEDYKLKQILNLPSEIEQSRGRVSFYDDI